MSEDNGPLLPHGGYRRLRSYKVARQVYDATIIFCNRFLSRERRLSEQMIQAARSGVRNISEGSGAAATSSKSEMKLTNVARASLSDELAGDFESFLTGNGFMIWPKDSPRALAMRKWLAKDGQEALPEEIGGGRFPGIRGLVEYVTRASPESSANALLCAINQAAYLLRRQMEGQSRRFTATGGFTENLYHRRSRSRSVSAGVGADAAAPDCPSCGKPMKRRLSRSGPGEGRKFWGCSAFPDCRQTLPIKPSDRSDPSDRSES